jgi:hypothetical protein
MNTTVGSFSGGANVYQNKVTGTGTSFMSVFCPAGQGPEGTIQYSTGTVSATAGSATLTGTGTTWNNANNVFVGYWVRFEGVSGGQPFVWATPISAIGGTGSITMTRAYPASATGVTNVAYSIIKIQQRFFTAGWTRPDATEGRTLYSGTGTCISDTRYYLSGGAEVYTGTQTGKSYSYVDFLWMTGAGNGTPNFYDEVLANYALWLRSGYEPAREAARKIGDYWLAHPQMDEGWVGSFPRNMSVAGIVAAAVADGKSSNWYAIRRLAEIGVLETANTACEGDTRERSYQLMWLALAANYDPLDTGNPATPGQRSYWKAKLVDSYNKDNGCKRADNSFMNGYNWTASSAMSVNNGSTTVTGTGFTASRCNWTASGTGTIVNGAGTFTLTSGTPVAGGKILLTGTRAGQPYNVYMSHSGTSGTIQIGGAWIGDTGAITWQTESDGWWSIYKIGSTISEGDQGEVYGCRYISPTELQLSRPWTGANTTDLRSSRFNVPGWGQQPFILGIKSWQMSLAGKGADGATGTDYTALAAAAATWIKESGYDTVTGGLLYGVGYQNCTPVVGAGGSTGGLGRQSECNYTTQYRGSAIALNAEAQNALRLWYEANPSPANVAFGDAFYAASWGERFVAPGFATDTNVNVYAETSELNEGKWYGFQFGVGMAHQWPAVRVGGVAPEDLRTIAVSSRLADVSGAVSIKITATRPNGTTSTATCTTGACSVTVDARQGTQWLITIEYYDGASGTGKRLAAGTQETSL